MKNIIIKTGNRKTTISREDAMKSAIKVRKKDVNGWDGLNTRTRTKAEIDKYRIKSYKYLDLD